MASANEKNRATRALLTSDTSNDLERVQVELWRQMSTLQKLDAVSDLTRAVKELSLFGIRQRNPSASKSEQFLFFALLTLGRELASEVYPEASKLSDR